MAEDIRESILVRLQALLKTIEDVDDVLRNAPVIDDGAPEARRIILFDGEELTPDVESVRGPPNTPRTVYMHPLIVLCNFAKPENVGPGLAEMRAAVIKAITTDAELIALTLNGHGARYLGMGELDLTLTQVVGAQPALRFLFPYLLRPDQF